MIHAVAGIISTICAVTKLHFGIIQVGNSANGAFMHIGAFLGRMNGRGGAETLPVADGAGFAVEKGNEIAGEEDYIVYKCDKRYKVSGEPADEHRNEEKDSVRNSQPFDFDGEKEKQQYAEIGIKGCKREEHRKVYVGRVGGNAGKQGIGYSTYAAAEIENVELKAAPFVFE